MKIYLAISVKQMSPDSPHFSSSQQ